MNSMLVGVTRIKSCHPLWTMCWGNNIILIFIATWSQTRLFIATWSQMRRNGRVAVRRFLLFLFCMTLFPIFLLTAVAVKTNDMLSLVRVVIICRQTWSAWAWSWPGCLWWWARGWIHWRWRWWQGRLKWLFSCSHWFGHGCRVAHAAVPVLKKVN